MPNSSRHNLNKNGKLYILSGGVGSVTYDANSVRFVKYDGADGIVVEADYYNSGDNYCGTDYIYLVKENERYVITKVQDNARDKGGYSYTSPTYEPVY